MTDYRKLCADLRAEKDFIREHYDRALSLIAEKDTEIARLEKAMRAANVCSLGTPGCWCDATHETAWACAWCGKMHDVDGGPKSMAAWCNNDCIEQHRAANPNCEHFRGFEPIADTLPGERYDGVWENSGMELRND